MTITLVVPGEPVAWQRARRNGKRYFTAPQVAECQERVRAAWMVAGRSYLGDGPLVVSAEFVCGRKPSHLKADGQPRSSAPAFPRPDIDNFLKGLLDSLNALAYGDDAQVVQLERVTKRYAEPGEEPFTELTLAASIS